MIILMKYFCIAFLLAVSYYVSLNQVLQPQKVFLAFIMPTQYFEEILVCDSVKRVLAFVSQQFFISLNHSYVVTIRMEMGVS